jgi:EmrB/QacA subfamily drug resistance transporter
MEIDAMHDRRWWALAVMCGSLLVITLDNTILNVALPALIRDTHASTSQLQWVIDGYTLVFAGLLLTTGSLGDRFGRKGALSTGLVVFGVGSAMSAMVSTAGQLVFTRAIMGVGGALIMPATLSLLTNVFADPKERGRAIGVWAAVAGAGGAVGPLIGGALLAHFWWGSVFLINVPVVVVALVTGRFLLPTSKDPDATGLDLLGAALSIAGLVGVLWAIIEAPVKGWGSPTVVGALVGGVVVIALFVVWELRCSDPMLDVRFFKNPRFTAANAAITLVFFAMFGAMFLITQYLQIVLGYSALTAGVRMLPMAVVMLVTAPMAPRLVEHIGTKAVVGTGLVIAGLGIGFVSFVPVADGYTHLVTGMIILSAGMGLTMAPATESVLGSLPLAKAGVGSAMNDTTRQMGGALGVAVIGSVFASSYRPAIGRQLHELGVSASVVAQAKDSVGGAIQATAGLPASLAQRITDLAMQDFVDGFQLACLVAMVIVLGAAVMVFKYLPAHAADAREELSGPLDGLASVTFAEAEGVLEEETGEEIADGRRLAPASRDGVAGPVTGDGSGDGPAGGGGPAEQPVPG